MPQDWQHKTVELRFLERMAARGDTFTSIFAWLKWCGLVPVKVEKVSTRHLEVQFNLNPDALPVEYIARSAFEWDSWGPSTPESFVRALAVEINGGSHRDVISRTLQELGRETAAASGEEYIYRCHTRPWLKGDAILMERGFNDR